MEFLDILQGLLELQYILQNAGIAWAAIANSKICSMKNSK